MNVLQTSLLIFLPDLLLLLYLRVVGKNRAGFGWRLGWRKDRGVVVISRLLESPAGHAKIAIDSVLLTRDGKPLNFANTEEFEAFFRAIPEPLEGEVITFEIARGTSVRTVCLKAESIWEKCPVYPPPPPHAGSDEYLYRRGMTYCTRTGQIVFTCSLSNAALDWVYSAR